MATEIKNELRAAAIVDGSDGGAPIQIHGMRNFQRTGLGVYEFDLDEGADAGEHGIYCAPGINELVIPRGRLLTPTRLEVRSYLCNGAPADCGVLFVEVRRYPGPGQAPFPAAPPVPTPMGGGAPSLVSWGNNAIAATGDTRYLDPWWDDTTATTTRAQWVATRAGIFENLAVIHNQPGGNGANIIYRLEVNAAPTALLVTLASTGSVAMNDVDMVAVAKGDLISMAAVKLVGIGSSPNDILATVNFSAP